jgi:hypothetical protein
VISKISRALRSRPTRMSRGRNETVVQNAASRPMA